MEHAVSGVRPRGPQLLARRQRTEPRVAVKAGLAVNSGAVVPTNHDYPTAGAGAHGSGNELELELPRQRRS